jgi:glycosyltransferase involved in cell wall biosynthesis
MTRPLDAPAVLVASILRPEGTTGVHTHIRELRWHLDNEGVPNQLVTPFSWGRALSGPLFSLRRPLLHVAPPTSVLWYRYWHTAFLTKALSSRLATLGPAVVYAQGPEAAQASLRARQGPHQRVVMAVHFLGSQSNGWVSKRHISPDGRVAKRIHRSEQLAVPDLDGIVYVSQAAREQFLASVPLAAQLPSVMIPNFVRYVEPPPGRPRRLADLVTVGHLEHEKNQEPLLRILASANKSGKSYTLDIYGQGSLRHHLEKVARSLGIAHLARFRGFDPNVRSFLPFYRAYLHTSLVESGPICVIEALAAGLPILAARRGGVPEIFEEGQQGYYWDPSDTDTAAKILVQLLEDEQARSTMARAARRRFFEHFDASTSAPSLEQFLFDLVANEVPGAPSKQPRAGRLL